MVWEPLSLDRLNSHQYQLSLLTNLEVLGCPSVLADFIFLGTAMEKSGLVLGN
jgi:hypothetical protein